MKIVFIMVVCFFSEAKDWAAEAFAEHISYGGLLSDGPNEGSDAAGFKLNRKF